jgi:hypothetical protein
MSSAIFMGVTSRAIWASRPPLQRRHSDDAGESDLAEHSPAEPESFDLAAVNGELAALGSR